MRIYALIALAALPAGAGIIEDVRAAIARKDFGTGEAAVREYRAARGVTPEMLEALSWLGRGTLAATDLDSAERYARETHDLAVIALKERRLDEERHLPIALGASIEVQAQVMAARGERSAAIDYLQQAITQYRTTSIRARLHKNLNLLTLEGKSALPVEGYKFTGKPTLIFLWAHWCGDCKRQGPVLARLRKEFDIAVVAPTQLYGYARRGEDAPPAEETKHIRAVWKQFYPELTDVPTPIDAETFANYGVSTTPTLVLVDAEGVVRLYHPGNMSYEDLAAKVRASGLRRSPL
jgi:thiol-disulfide isomerase/thioredoxin